MFAAGADEATVGEYKNRFKDLLMRKTLDGQLDTPWSADDEREFRTKFTEGLGGVVRKSEAAAGLRAKESSLVARLGGSETGRLDGALVFSYPLADAGAQEARP